MKKRSSWLSIGVLLLFLFLAACSSSSEETGNTSDEGNSDQGEKAETVVLRLAENQPDNNPVTIAMYEFADLVEEKTNGEVKIEVYANGQLGEETANIDQVQAGALDMARVNSVPVAQIVDEIGVFTTPFIFADQEHKYRVLDGEIGEEVLAKFEDHGMVSFGYLEAGTRNFYTTDKPIESVEDMKGLRIRVQPSDISVKMVQLLGAVPTPMDYGEVFTALQTGVIDGAENDFVSYYTSGHFEAAPHYTLNGHLSPPALVIMNKQTWDGLSEEHQLAIKESAAIAIEAQRESMNEMQEEFRKEVEEAGSVIYEVDVEEFQEAINPIFDEMPQYEELIERIRALQ
ncbi:TRAP transporter substrate-binding protein [Halalkalibacter krulwichiae]|uniref:2,3-diketo-L-gulonate-binding periplasmic protein YiaO n=1 Tax=Halalkalibacter krulwichiae TaxID=199441 RepID=A0A1X9MG48_9BACI|nr:TRAP transporter substrate-binding protein [Halalkalibacter krulwichiae]ARK32429.1 2,3-diketo-L-gulonate-binding periplasmic protein YiaO precursor [Halalkalibacter krulwichiae]